MALDASVRCLEPRHGSSKVVKNGFYTDGDGVRFQRYICRLPSGGKHSFLGEPVGDVPMVARAPKQAPPACPDHPGSTVARNGGYGKAVKKQQYKCSPGDGSEPHFFALPLPREYIGDDQVLCPDCEEPLGVHSGGQASARQAKWPMRAVVECLKELADGAAYTKASLAVWEKTAKAQAHARSHLQDWSRMNTPAEDAGSWDSKRGRAAWHLAADLLEQYGPVLAEHVLAAEQEWEAEQRVINDDLLAEGQVPAAPITFVLDEVPMFVRLNGGPSMLAWTVHNVVSVFYRHTPDGVMRENRLRLSRALPGAGDEASWRLVLGELGVRPDVVVADFGSAIRNAVEGRWPGRITRIPSLYHFAQGIEAMFKKFDGFHDGKGRNRQPRPEFMRHLSLISRRSLDELGEAGWRSWWDELEALTVRLGAPLTAVTARRAVYELDVVDAIAATRAQPFLPLSNSAVEVKSRTLFKPILRGRGQQFRNLARTNALLDLVLCRDHGLFNDMEKVRSLIREDNAAWGGWATPRRSFDDRQPPQLTDEDDSYSSLLDGSIVGPLLAAREARA